MDIKLNTIEEALEDFKQGKFLIVVDDEDRENEGDFIIAAEKVTPEKINFMMRYGRGVLCAPISEERAAQLELEMQVPNNTSVHETPFTITVDRLGNGCTTGVSMYDRAQTILALADPNTLPTDLARPGHICPLKARSRGVLRRAGHTEAAVDLTKLCGMQPAAALIEIINEDGTMARMPQLVEVGKKWDIKIITIKDLIAYRLKRDCIVERGVEVKMPTEFGDFKLVPYRQKSNGLEHIALFKGDVSGLDPLLVRMHSSCATGDIFASKRCDCGEQLHHAMRVIEQEGRGLIVYLNQEGRGIGLMDKMKAYRLQEQGMDTVDANLCIGHEADERDYGVGAQILRDLGVSKMRLMTNNPIKRVGLEAYGLEIVEVVPLEVMPNHYNENYLRTKRDRMGHTLRKLK
ncbi:MAG: bifunctional 3,4-dihydroxy-2-butanone-4-phosphate synthase/GTP cyclohydrolase II [Porphyromonas sp.]|nr:bifunctional 3,4-dihydroxy-2-butanone-4-phosphate synthase/GTP cyclohydrolase II [Porphyromonas sp.]